jgi:phage terminase large subunit-like protein
MRPANDRRLTLSTFQRLLTLPDDQFVAAVAALNAADRRMLETQWHSIAHPGQLAPVGDWRLWLIQAGRGFGKTRAGAEWIDALARKHSGIRIALVGATLKDVRSVMIEGDSGLLNLPGRRSRPHYAPSLGQLTWDSGAMAASYSAADPEGLRGPQFDFAWADEVGRWALAADGWRALAAWNNLMLALRSGEDPRAVITTTPRATELMRKIRAMGRLVVTGGATEANAANMPASWMDAMRHQFAGTRLERQELDGELIEDVEGALWTRELLERCRMGQAEFDESALTRVVIGVDPPASADGDACGIIVCGATGDGRLLVLSDASVSGRSPDGWARVVAETATRWRAERVVAEANNGGAMVQSVLKSVDPALPVRLVHATRGKVARAEPIHALYEQDKVRHVGALARLEDELCGLIVGGSYAGPGRSPDRADACVWALTELASGLGKAGPGVRLC